MKTPATKHVAFNLDIERLNQIVSLFEEALHPSSRGHFRQDSKILSEQHPLLMAKISIVLLAHPDFAEAARSPVEETSMH